MDFDSRFGHTITQCRHKIQYTFTNELLSAESLNNAGPTASGYVTNGKFTTLPKNDRLAVYGDIVATAMLCRDWYHESSSKGGVTLATKPTMCNFTYEDKLPGRQFVTSF